MEFFAGANTRGGFVSIFEECLRDTERIYILKGSSGCGKSTLMRRVAGKAKKLNLATDLIYCSADVNSLDGVIIPQKSVAIIDGTAPHIMDAKYPCVRESIINLGQFWNKDKILPHRDKIITLTDKKSMHYKNAYSILSLAGKIADIKKSFTEKCIDREKSESAAFKFIEAISGESNNRHSQIFASAFTADGFITLPVFTEVNTLYRINGICADAFLKAVEQISIEHGKNITISRSPFDTSITDAVYFHEAKVLITSLDIPPCKNASEEKQISISRFADKNQLQSSRARVRALQQLESELLLDAQKELMLARETHSAIEDIYVPAMRFSEMDEYTLSLIERIFAE